MSTKKKNPIAHYKTLSNYCVGTMDRERVRQVIWQMKKFQAKLDGAITTEMVGEDIVMEKIGIKELKSFLVNRMERFFENGIRLFSSNYDFWICYIKFGKRNIPDDVAMLYRKSLEQHGDKQPGLWCNALFWANKIKRTEEQMNDLFQEASKHHPKSEDVYTTYFGIVLREIGTTTNKRKTMKKLLAIYKLARANMNSDAPFMAFLEQCESPRYRDFTAPLQYRIMIEIMALKSRGEEMWHIFAQRELRGLNMWNFLNIPRMDEDDDVMTVKPIEGRFFEESTMEQRVKSCCDVYITAVFRLKTEKMVQIYVDAMIDLNRFVTEDEDIRYGMLVQAYRNGHDLRLLSEEHYYKLIQLFCSNGGLIPLALEVLPIALQRHRSSRLFLSWISCLILEKKETEIQNVLRIAMRRLQPAAVAPIWELVLLYYTSLGKNYKDTCHSLHREACRYTHPSFLVFRPMYLEYSMAYLKIEKTRSHYDKLCRIPPPSYELHKKMLEIELSVDKKQHNMKRMRTCFDRAIRDFGKENVMVWIDFINHEKKHGNKRIIKPVVEKARKLLNPEPLERFETMLKVVHPKSAR